MHSCVTRVPCLVLSVVLTFGPLVNAQNAAAPADTAPAGGNPAKQSRRPLSDYVACTFYGGDDYELRARDTPPPPPPLPEKKLDSSETQQLWDQVYVALSKSLSENDKYNPEFLQEFKKYYRENLKVDSLIGLTRDQANTHIQTVIADAGGAASSKYSPLLTEETRGQASNQMQGIVAECAKTFVARELTNVPKGQRAQMHLNANEAN